jgi:hypothetical protein
VEISLSIEASQSAASCPRRACLTLLGSVTVCDTAETDSVVARAVARVSLGGPGTGREVRRVGRATSITLAPSPATGIAMRMSRLSLHALSVPMTTHWHQSVPSLCSAYSNMG